jgi:hypothetical protein
LSNDIDNDFVTIESYIKFYNRLPEERESEPEIRTRITTKTRIRIAYYSVSRHHFTMSNNFEGKLAIITGASKPNGIGYATAYALAQAGADVSTLNSKDNNVNYADRLKARPHLQF